MGIMLSRSKTTTINWDNVNNKPAILSDNQISWDEIQGVPQRLVEFLALQPSSSVLGVIFTTTGTLDTLRINQLTTAGGLAIVRRDTSNNITANNYIGLSIPSSPTGLSSGTFYKDVNGFIKVV